MKDANISILTKVLFYELNVSIRLYLSVNMFTKQS